MPEHRLHPRRPRLRQGIRQAVHQIVLNGQLVVVGHKVAFIQHRRAVGVIHQLDRHKALLRPIVALIDELNGQRFPGAARLIDVVVRFVMHHKGREGVQRGGDQAGQADRVGVLRRPVGAGVTIDQVDIDIARIEQQARLVDRRPRLHARQRHQRHTGAQRQQEQPPHQGGGEAFAGRWRAGDSGSRRWRCHRRGKIGGGVGGFWRPTGSRWHGNSGRRRRRQRLHLRGEFLPLLGAPDHRHRELIPPFGYRRDVLKANVVAVFERLAQFGNTLRDDVAGHNVPGPDVFDKLVPAKHFPRMAGKKDQKID